MSHTKNFVHARGDSVDRSGAADFVFKLGRELATAGADSFAFFTIWVPGVFFFGAGFLAEGRESDLGEAVFDNFIARLELVFFPVAEFASGGLDGLGDFGDLLICKWVVVDLDPVVFGGVVAVILRPLGYKKM